MESDGLVNGEYWLHCSEVGSEAVSPYGFISNLQMETYFRTDVKPIVQYESAVRPNSARRSQLFADIPVPESVRGTSGFRRTALLATYREHVA